MNALKHVYGKNLIVRPPVPATCNKGGANYKSEVKHLEYSPRRAFDEWLSICDAIVAAGGDALYAFESADDAFLDQGDLQVEADGSITAVQSHARVGHLDDVMTGRVFTANGPWVTVTDAGIRAVMPNMLAHRRGELPYYRDLLTEIALSARLPVSFVETPDRWEGMADVAVVGDRVVLTYAVPGHYDENIAPKSKRSSLEGVTFAANESGIPDSARVYAELVYPHFHGDTVHFGARPTNGQPVLVHYKGGLWGDGAEKMERTFPGSIAPIGREDAVEAYAGNSRQVANGVLVPDGVSDAFNQSLRALGLSIHPVPLFELFGKAGGGPACATLYLPANLEIPLDAPFRYSVSRDAVKARRARLPERLLVSPDYFAGKSRG